MAYVYQQARDTAAAWTAANPVLPQGILAYETDTLKWKLGDGTTAWNSLGYSSSLQNSSVVSEINAALTDDDELLVYDDSANEPELRKSLLSRIWTYISGKVTGTINTFTANQIFNPGIVLINTATDNASGAKLQVAGSVTVTGYSKLGDSAPSIKMKKLTGTTASTENAEATVAHGLTSTKIIGTQAMVFFSEGLAILPGYSQSAGYEYSVIVNATLVKITNHPTNSENILSKPFTVLITYEE